MLVTSLLLVSGPMANEAKSQAEHASEVKSTRKQQTEGSMAQSHKPVNLRRITGRLVVFGAWLAVVVLVAGQGGGGGRDLGLNCGVGETEEVGEPLTPRLRRE